MGNMHAKCCKKGMCSRQIGTGTPTHPNCVELVALKRMSASVYSCYMVATGGPRVRISSLVEFAKKFWNSLFFLAN